MSISPNKFAKVLAAAQTAFPTLYEAQAPGSAGSQSVLVGPVRRGGPGVPAEAGGAGGDLVKQWLRAAHVQRLPQVDTQNARQDA